MQLSIPACRGTGDPIDFAVERLVDDVVAGRVRAVILTGTAGDRKTHLALRILDALGLDRDAVTGAQQNSAYCKDGYLIDLDLRRVSDAGACRASSRLAGIP